MHRFSNKKYRRLERSIKVYFQKNEINKTGRNGKYQVEDKKVLSHRNPLLWIRNAHQNHSEKLEHGPQRLT